MVVFFFRYRCKESGNALPWLLQEGAEVGCYSSGTKIQMDCISHTDLKSHWSTSSIDMGNHSACRWDRDIVKRKACNAFEHASVCPHVCHPYDCRNFVSLRFYIQSMTESIDLSSLHSFCKVIA